MQLKRWLLASVLLLLKIHHASAAFEHYTIEDGLSQSVVFSIEQDQLGFMWFATQDGLNRFDGERFEVFKASDKNTNSLANNYIYPLSLDNQNQLFIGTRYGGINQLNLFNYRFAPPQLDEKRITALLPYEKWLFVGTFDGFVYRIERGSARISTLIDNLNKPVYALEIIDNVLWIGSNGSGLVHYDLKSESVVPALHDDIFRDEPIYPSIYAIKQDADSHVWIATQGGGAYKIDLVQRTITNWRHDEQDFETISSNQIRDIEFDEQGRVWFATRGGGVSIFNQPTQRFTHLKHDPFDRYSLAHNRVYSVFKDQSGIMWFGTANGVSKLDPASMSFTKLRKPTPLSSNDAWALYEDAQQRLWYGSWGAGIDILDKNFNRVGRLDKESSPITLSSNAIKVITQDGLGNTWIGTWEHGINVITKDGKLIAYHVGEGEHGLDENSIYSLLADSHNNVWVGTNGGGLFKFDHQSQKFISYSKTQRGSSLLVDAPRVTSIYQGENSELWIATDGRGAYKYNTELDTITHFTKRAEGEGLSHNTVRAFLSRDNGDMWLATSNGVNIIKAGTEKIRHIGVDDGLPNQVVYGLVAQGKEFVWLSTNNGLAKINSTTGVVRHFQAKDGIQGNEFNAGVYYKTSQGKIIFGGTQGLTVFSSDEQQTLLPAKLALTKLKFDDEPLKNSIGSQLGMHYEIEKSRQLAIPYSVKRISLSVNLLHFSEPKTNMYRYRLIGFEQQWRSAKGASLSIDYTNLPAGHYQLVVEANSLLGAKALAPLMLNLHVLTPWWQTSLAYFIYCLLCVALVWLCISLWTQRLRNQKNELERFVALRTQEIASQKSVIEKQAIALGHTLESKVRFFTHASHELRTPLSLLVAPTQALLACEENPKKRANLDLILRNSRRLEGLVDKLLTLTRFEQSNDEAVKVVSLSALAREVAEQFSVLGEQNILFDYHIEEALYVNASREGLITIFNNLLSNAFKFTTQGKVELHVYALQQHAVIDFKDTGRGIAEVEASKVYDLFYRTTGNTNVEGSGVGLSIVKKLVDKYAGQIALQSTLLKGTQFSVKFALVCGPKQLHDKHNEQIKTERAQNEGDLATVLIAEDNDELRHYLQKELAIKYHVLLAGNGKAAMALMKKHVPDLLITDLMMPKMDGFTLLKEAHHCHITCHIPAIILTAKGDHESKLKGLNHFALDVITKPFNRDELLIKVDNWVTWVNTYHQYTAKENQPVSVGIHTVNRDPKDAQLLANLNAFLEVHYQDTQLTVPRCAKELALSERQFQRKLKVLIDLSPTEFIRDFRLARAAELLVQGRQINLVIEDVGFTSRSYFSKAFKAKYGMTAKEYQASN